MPLSFLHSWMRMNAAPNRLKKTNRMITLHESHLYCEPPHWRASSRQMTEPRMQRVPAVSNCLNFSFLDKPLAAVFVGSGK